MRLWKLGHVKDTGLPMGHQKNSYLELLRALEDTISRLHLQSPNKSLWLMVCSLISVHTLMEVLCPSGEKINRLMMILKVN
jgi:hypothetical protein